MKLQIDLDAFVSRLEKQTVLAGLSLEQFQANYDKIQSGTAEPREKSEMAEMVSIALLMSMSRPQEDDRTQPVAVFLEDRVTGVITAKP